MGITSIKRDWGVAPSMVRITTTDTLADVNQTGYITSQAKNIEEVNKGAFDWAESDSVLVFASDGTQQFEISSDFSSLIPESGGGSGVVLINTGAGLTGGPITNTGTISLADIPANTFLANVSGGSAVPTANNSLVTVQNLGLGEQNGRLTLTDADFAAGGGTYIIANPPPTIIYLQNIGPSRNLRLPPQNEETSLQASQTIEILSDANSFPVEIQFPLGGGILFLNPDSAQVWTPNTRGTFNGNWAFQGEVISIQPNAPSGPELTGAIQLVSTDGSIDISNVFNNIDFKLASGAISIDQTIYIAPNGVDNVSRNGSISQPYATISFALSQITTASQTTPFQIIVSTGDYSETSLVLKPWVYINGHASSLTVTGSVTLDPLWVNGGNCLINNFYNADFQGDVNLNFDALSQTGLAVMTFDTINGASAFSYNITGSTAGTTICVFNNIVGYGSQQNINVTNCYGGMANSAPNDVTYTQSDAINGHVWNMQSGQTIGSLTIESNAGNLQYFSNGLNSYGSFTLYTTGTGTMTAYPLRSTALGGVKFDSVGSGLNVTVDGYFGSDPIIVGTPNITYGTLATGINANYPSPTNYTPVTPEITGHLQGINNALLGGVGISAGYGEMYFQGNSTATTFAGANTPVKAVSTYSTGDVNGFLQASGTLTYIETNPSEVEVIANFTAYYNGTSQNTSFYIAKNGVVVAKSKQSVYIGPTTNIAEPYSAKCLLSLVTNDTVELWVENNDNTNSLFIQDLNFTVKTLSASAGASVDLQIAYNNGNTIIETAGGYNPLRLQKNVQEPITEEIFYNNLSPTVPIVAYQKNYLAWDASNLGIDFVTEKLVYWDSTGANAKFSYSWEMYEGGLANIQYEYMAVDSRYKQIEMFRPVRMSDIEDLSTVTANPISCLYDTDSTTRGGRPWPRMTTAQKNLILSPVQGLTVYDTTENKPNYYDGAAWQSLIVEGTLATSQVPTTDYSGTIGTFASVVNTWSGSNVIAANSVAIGDTIELTLNGYTSAVTTGGSGIIRVQIGSTTADSQTFTSNLGGAGSQRIWQLTFAVTRSSSTTASISVVGFVENDARVMIPMQIYINPTAFTFDFTVANTMDVLYNMTVGVDAYIFVARNLKIVKY